MRIIQPGFVIPASMVQLILRVMRFQLPGIKHDFLVNGNSQLTRELSKLIDSREKYRIKLVVCGELEALHHAGLRLLALFLWPDPQQARGSSGKILLAGYENKLLSIYRILRPFSVHKAMVCFE